jgi:ATP-dependent Clp protease adapter protein ClpS
MLTVHANGHATVWSGARSQAEAMAARATTVARDKEMPLRIRVEADQPAG